MSMHSPAYPHTHKIILILIFIVSEKSGDSEIMLNMYVWLKRWLVGKSSCPVSLTIWLWVLQIHVNQDMLGYVRSSTTLTRYGGHKIIWKRTGQLAQDIKNRSKQGRLYLWYLWHKWSPTFTCAQARVCAHAHYTYIIVIKMLYNISVGLEN